MELDSCPALSPHENDVSFGQNSAEQGKELTEVLRVSDLLDKVDKLERVWV